MLTRSKPTWELPASIATTEADFLNRRELCKKIAAGSILAGGPSLIFTPSAGATQKNDFWNSTCRPKCESPLTGIASGRPSVAIRGAQVQARRPVRRLM